MKLCLAAMLATCLAATSTASAATMTVDPKRSCYSSGETVRLKGSGFSPNGTVTIARDGVTPDSDNWPTLNSNAAGEFVADLTLYLKSGSATRSYTATDVMDPSIVAMKRMLVIAPVVNIKPPELDVSLPARIGARGFATGPTLYVHILRTTDAKGKALKGQKARNMRIGHLKGRCGKVLARKRLFSKRAPLGDYSLQFDTYKRYDADRSVKYVYGAPVTLEASHKKKRR